MATHSLTPPQLREACNINRSLSALGNVINALTALDRGAQV